MFKKSLASIVSATILVAGPGNLTLTAAAQTMGRAPVTGVSVIPTVATGLNSPALAAPSLNMPTLGALTSTSLMVAPSIAAPSPVVAAAPVALVATPILPAAAKATVGSPLAIIKSQDPKVGIAEKGSALNALFENSMVTGHESIEVFGKSAESGLGRSEIVSAKSPVAFLKSAKNSLRTQAVSNEPARRKAALEQDKKDKGAAGGLIVELGVIAFVIAGILMLSTPFEPSPFSAGWRWASRALGAVGMAYLLFLLFA